MTMTTKVETYRQRIEAEIEEQKVKLEAMKVDAAQKVADSKLAIHEEIRKLESKLDGAKSTFEELKDAGEDAWEKFSKSFMSMFSK